MVVPIKPNLKDFKKRIKIYHKHMIENEVFDKKVRKVIPDEIMVKINLMYGDFKIVKKEENE
jgi:hypothetical protein